VDAEKAILLAGLSCRYLLAIIFSGAIPAWTHWLRRKLNVRRIGRARLGPPAVMAVAEKVCAWTTRAMEHFRHQRPRSVGQMRRK
jgi:hypothetical protein